MNNLTVFLPIFNESENIAKVATDTLKFLESNVTDYELLLINDGSTDNTLSILEDVASTNIKVKVIDHVTNKGYGAAIKTGIKNATYDWVFFMDSDGQFDINDLAKFFPLTESSDLVIGYRHQRGDKIHRLLLSNAYKGIVKKLFSLVVTDIDCAFKLMKKSKVSELQIKADSFFVSTELLCRAQRKGHKISEMPVSHFPRGGGKSTVSIKKSIDSLIELLKLFKSVRHA